MGRRWLGTGIAVALALVGTTGVATEEATAGPSKAMVEQGRTTNSVTLAYAGSTPTTVLSVVVPAGLWSVTSNLTAVDFGSGDFVRCQIQVNGQQVDGGSTVFLADRVAGVEDNGSFSVSGLANVSLLCRHDEDATSSGQFTVDPGATLTAVPSPGRNGVVAAETSSPTVLNNSSMVPVTSVFLRSGSWTVSADLSAVDFSGPAHADCTYTITNTGSNGSDFDFPDVTTDPSDASVASEEVLARVTAGQGGSKVILTCQSTAASGMTVDPGAYLLASKGPAADFSRQLNPTPLPDPAGGEAPVFYRPMPAGTFRFTSSAIVDTPTATRDFIRCSLQANGSDIDGLATLLVTPGAPRGQIVNAGVYTSSSSWTLGLVCTHDATYSGGGGHVTVDYAALSSVQSTS